MEVLEVLAAQRTTLCIVELGIQQFVFEGDLEVVCKALTDVDFFHSAIGHIIKDVVFTISSLRTHASSHTRWQGKLVFFLFSSYLNNIASYYFLKKK